MPKLVAVQLETCHANSDGTAWYAYFDGKLPGESAGVSARKAFQKQIEQAAKEDGAPLGIELEDEFEEVETSLSRHAKLFRYYVGGAV